jgi:hypothetical protein
VGLNFVSMLRRVDLYLESTYMPIPLLIAISYCPIAAKLVNFVACMHRIQDMIFLQTCPLIAKNQEKTLHHLSIKF